MNESEFQAAIDGAITQTYRGIRMSIAGVKHPTPNFRFLTGDVDFVTYGGSWASKSFNNGDFDYTLVIELRNNHEDTGDETLPKYRVSLSVVSPEAAGPGHLADAFQSMGLDDEFTAELREKRLFQVEALYTYGTYAEVWSAEGNDWRKLIQAAHRQALFVNSFFGFYLDAPRNAFGNTGWDFVAGEIGFK